MAIIEKYAQLIEVGTITGNYWTVQYSARVKDEEVYCGMYAAKDYEAAAEAYKLWMNSDPRNDDLAIRLTDAYFDPFDGAEYGEVLRNTVEALGTPDGMRLIIEEQLDKYEIAVDNDLMANY